jgi:site-specific DNA-methyltransferase (adenine-specific)
MKIEEIVNTIIIGDCIKIMSEMPEKSVDLIVTSPPYGVGIDYDTFEDDLEFDQ